jgi:hypothetical protein
VYVLILWDCELYYLRENIINTVIVSNTLPLLLNCEWICDLVGSYWTRPIDRTCRSNWCRSPQCNLDWCLWPVGFRYVSQIINNSWVINYLLCSHDNTGYLVWVYDRIADPVARTGSKLIHLTLSSDLFVWDVISNPRIRTGRLDSTSPRTWSNCADLKCRPAGRSKTQWVL